MLEESVLFQKQMEEGKVCYGIDLKKKNQILICLWNVRKWLNYLQFPNQPLRHQITWLCPLSLGKKAALSHIQPIVFPIFLKESLKWFIAIACLFCQQTVSAQIAVKVISGMQFSNRTWKSIKSFSVRFNIAASLLLGSNWSHIDGFVLK